MYSAAISDGCPIAVRVDATLDLVASGLDAHFVEAGTALARAYDIVEKLIADLEGVTDTLDCDAAARAVENMQMTAERLERLPQSMAARAEALATIEHAGMTVREQLVRVGRTLEFLRICGLNIKVAAGGRNGFAEFADAMFAKLDLSEKEISGIRSELQELASVIPRVVEVDRALAAQCAILAADVPRRLAADALGLQAHLNGVSALSEGISAVARQIRAKLGDALGAMQIGDITRQRLEHVATGYKMLVAAYPHDGPHSETDQAVEGHFLALLTAQLDETINDFRHENQRLVESLRAIGPDVAIMLAMQGDGGSHANGDAAFLDTLENSVAEVSKVTTGLRDADSRSHGLGSDTAMTVERLGQRLQVIHQVTGEVHNMAWNTDLRCYRMGREGNGLARVATEIRNFVRMLESISERVAFEVGKLNESALAIAGSTSKHVTGETLEQSLATIRDGALRMRENLSHLEADASLIGSILDDSAVAVDCEKHFAKDLEIISRHFCSLSLPMLSDEAEPAIHAAPLLDSMAQLYTMDKERVIHKKFSHSMDELGNADADPQLDDDLDDGLF
ncbi:methyl-accepting chemotaxis protein [Novosphingobium sp. Rr 2-17]|nr:methyl-accepting chemotaxis protein [Novosphingobium sp. Rr 2-17]